MYLDIHDPNLLHGPIRSIDFDVLDIMNNLETFSHSSKNGMFVIKPWTGKDGNEELAGVCAWSGIGHAEAVRSIGVGVSKGKCLVERGQTCRAVSLDGTRPQTLLPRWIRRLIRLPKDHQFESSTIVYSTPTQTSSIER